MGAFALGKLHALFMDVEQWREPALHHELFHLFEDAPGAHVPKDSEWMELNPPGFAYFGRNFDLVREAGANAWKLAEHSDEHLGFVSGHACSEQREDRAEIFSVIMTDPGYLERRMRTDSFLRQKVVAVKRAVKERVPEMDDDFWPSAR
jgi:hypothetical protein